MTDISRISDSELNQIEFESSDLFLEDAGINGIQLRSIIQRLREAERAVELTTPYVTRAADRQKAQELSEKWGPFRFFTLLGGLAAGVAGMATSFWVIQPVDDWLTDNQVWVFIGMTTLSFILPMCVVSLPLLKKIDKVVVREMEKSRG